MDHTTHHNLKYPVVLSDGIVIEAVYYGSGTLCVSSQAGCALACPFCASGKQGLHRQLTPKELHQQLEQLRDSGIEPQRVTISGIGEPLHNWENIRKFTSDCQDQGIDVSVTTTAANLDHLEELIHLARNGVMISLHAATPDTHRKLIPNGPNFQHLCSKIDQIITTLSRRKRRKIGINYLLLTGINDHNDDLLALERLMSHWQDFTLHLLRYNPVDDKKFFSDIQKVDLWHEHLQRSGIRVRRPNRWRNLTEGGCGTLFARPAERTEIKDDLCSISL